VILIFILFICFPLGGGPSGEEQSLLPV